MIDSITIVIHNLQKYHLIYEQYYLPNAKKKGQFVDAYVDTDAVLQGTAFTHGTFYSDSGKFLPISFRTSLFVRSSDYSISMLFSGKDPSKPSLEMTFSIPKYLYGTNVFQFVGPAGLDSQAIYYRLRDFIDRFMRDNFHQLPSKNDVEIKRLDICYNQFFLNKTEALMYQRAQRDHVENWARTKNMTMYPQPGSGTYDWSILTQRYSFKCYHKGTEFYKNDYPQLSRRRGRVARGKPDGTSVSTKLDLNYIQEQADKILRYEITFRNSMLHYLVGYNCFESSERTKPFYITDDNVYKYVRRVDKHGQFSAMAAVYRKKKGHITTAKEWYVQHVKSLRLHSVFDMPYSPLTIALSPESTFNYLPFRLAFDFFWNHVREVQVETRSSVPEMVKKIEDYQAHLARRKGMKLTRSGGGRVAKGGVNIARVLIPALLAQHQDLRSLKPFLPRNTYQRLISDVKKIGIPMKLETMQIVLPKLGLEDYNIYLRHVCPSYDL
ncbi:MAG TPA: phage/plasmid replication protein [Candidatus Saccharimonadales bacterium]|nr:phage/plasmid replication protein [Candidatus Saccharimonadales bacterium]